MDSEDLANHRLKPFFEIVDKNALPKLRAALAVSLKLNTTEELYLLRGLATRAASRGQRDILEYFCLDRGVKINFIPKEGKYSSAKVTPLLGALQTGKEDVALFLLELHKSQQQQQKAPAEESRLDLSRPFGDKGNTLLHYTVFWNTPRLAKALLVEHGANPDLENLEGHTALCLAVVTCHRELMNVFPIALSRSRPGEIEMEKEEKIRKPAPPIPTLSLPLFVHPACYTCLK